MLEERKGGGRVGLVEAVTGPLVGNLLVGGCPCGFGWKRIARRWSRRIALIPSCSTLPLGGDVLTAA